MKNIRYFKWTGIEKDHYAKVLIINDKGEACHYYYDGQTDTRQDAAKCLDYVNAHSEWVETTEEDLFLEMM